MADDDRRAENEAGMVQLRLGDETAANEVAAASPQILDACCGGRMWWWDKDHPLAVYMDIQCAPKGSAVQFDGGKRHASPGWSCEPDVVASFTEMPFDDESFRMVVFDPPHNVRPGGPRGVNGLMYGALHPDTEQDDLRRGFAECWRVLAPGGTLIFKWAGDIKRVKPHFPATPIVGTRSPRGLQTWWLTFYKELIGGGVMADDERRAEIEAVAPAEVAAGVAVLRAMLGEVLGTDEEVRDMALGVLLGAARVRDARGDETVTWITTMLRLHDKDRLLNAHSVADWIENESAARSPQSADHEAEIGRIVRFLVDAGCEAAAAMVEIEFGRPPVG